MGQTDTQSAVDELSLAIEVEGIIVEARKQWALDDQWKIDWGWIEPPNPKYPSCSNSDESGWTQKRARLGLDTRLKDEWHDRLCYEIYHELGHCVLAGLWRGVTDWMDHIYPMGTRERDIFEDTYNTDENQLLDHLIVQIFGIR